MMMSRHCLTSTVIAIVLVSLIAMAHAIDRPCPGDHDQNGGVSLSELQSSVNSYLGSCPGRYQDNGDGTVTDWQTGLVWEKTTDDGGIHDKDNTYFWRSGGGSAPNGTAFTTFLATLNGGVTGVGNCVSDDTTIQSGGFAGHCDWRLPTIGELRTIIAVLPPCGMSPCIDPIFGPTKPSFYWTATTSSADAGFAWVVDFDTGEVPAPFTKGGGLSVRAVRGRDTSGEAGPRYANRGGAVLDRKTTLVAPTGLMWEPKTDDGSVHDKDNLYTWSITSTPPDGTAFTTFLATLNGGVTGVGNCVSSDGITQSGGYLGHCDWRVPTFQELQGILLAPHPCGSSPCIDSAFGPTASLHHWSANTHASLSTSARFVNFSNGSLGQNLKSNTYGVRAVRGGL